MRLPAASTAMAGVACSSAVACAALSGIDELEKVNGPVPRVEDGGFREVRDPPRCNVERPFGPPVRVEELGVPGEEDSDARLSADERTVYFQSTAGSDRAAPVHRIWVATRAERARRFGAPTLLELEPGVSFYDPVVTADGLTILVQRGASGSRLQFSTRPDPGAHFLPPRDVPGVDVADREERDPWLAADGRLLFTRMDTAPTPAAADVYIAGGSLDAGFMATALAGLNGPGLERNPVLVRDGLRIYFSSDRAASPNWQRVFTARRAESTEPFGAPREIDELVAPEEYDYDAPTWISEDGCVLYLSSNRPTPEGRGVVHIYAARRGS